MKCKKRTVGLLLFNYKIASTVANDYRVEGVQSAIFDKAWWKGYMRVPFLSLDGVFDKYDMTALFPRCALIPESHRAKLLLKKGD